MIMCGHDRGQVPSFRTYIRSYPMVPISLSIISVYTLIELKSQNLMEIN